MRFVSVAYKLNLAFVVLQMGAFRERSVLTLRKRAKKRSDEVLQKPDGGA